MRSATPLLERVRENHESGDNENEYASVWRKSEIERIIKRMREEREGREANDRANSGVAARGMATYVEQGGALPRPRSHGTRPTNNGKR